MTLTRPSPNGSLGIDLVYRGQPPSQTVRISKIAADSPADKSGHIKVGDALMVVNGTRIHQMPLAAVARAMAPVTVQLVLLRRPVAGGGGGDGGGDGDAPAAAHVPSSDSSPSSAAALDSEAGFDQACLRVEQQAQKEASQMAEWKQRREDISSSRGVSTIGALFIASSLEKQEEEEKKKKLLEQTAAGKTEAGRGCFDTYADSSSDSDTDSDTDSHSGPANFASHVLEDHGVPKDRAKERNGSILQHSAVGVLPHSPYNPAALRLAKGTTFGSADCQAVQAGHDVPLPLLLLALADAYREEGGLLSVAHFQAPRRQDEYSKLRTQIRTAETALLEGTFKQRRWGPSVLAALIKLWFQRMPRRVLVVLKTPQVLNGQAGSDLNYGEQMLDSMSEPSRSLFNWVLELMAEAVEGATAAAPADAADADGPNTGKGVASAFVTNAVLPALVSIVDFRMHACGSDHTVEDGLEASDLIVDFVRSLVNNRIETRASSAEFETKWPLLTAAGVRCRAEAEAAKLRAAAAEV